MKTKLTLLALTLAAFAAPVTRADGLDINLSADIRLGRRPPPAPPPVVVIEDTQPKEAPPWEHGRWYQRNQAYYYYPGGDVYYRPADHVWFYRDRGEWRSGRSLPEAVNIDFGRSVTLTMATDRPYEYHPQVLARYPANYFGTKVRLREEERHEHENDDHGRDREKPKDRDERR